MDEGCFFLENPTWSLMWQSPMMCAFGILPILALLVAVHPHL
jgi:hypothetical protein